MDPTDDKLEDFYCDFHEAHHHRLVRNIIRSPITGNRYQLCTMSAQVLWWYQAEEGTNEPT